QQHMRLGLKSGQVFVRIIPSLTQAPRVEKYREGVVRVGKVIARRPAGAGREPRADLGALGSGQSADDRGLASLHLAEEPDHRRWQPLAQAAQRSPQCLVIKVRGKEVAEP